MTLCRFLLPVPSRGRSRLPALLFGLTFGLLAAPVCHAQAAPIAPDQLRTLSRDELDVVKVLTKQEDAWNHGDLALFATGYKDSSDILFIGHQVSRGYDQMVADYKHNYPNKETMGTLSFGDLEPHILDEHYAVVIGRYKLERGKKNGGNAEGIFSLVLEKTVAGWKIIVDHTTS